jgi:hypothetical protein
MSISRGVEGIREYREYREYRDYREFCFGDGYGAFGG